MSADKINCVDDSHGDWKACFSIADRYEFPRQQDAILKPSTKEILTQYNCEWFRMKVLMVRLRRGKGEDWETFKKMFEDGFGFYIDRMNARWLISILDTYIDYADDVTSRNAMMATMTVNHEKWKQTELCIYDPNSQRKIRPTVYPEQVMLWGGLKTLRPRLDDAPRIFYGRIFRLLDSTPMISEMFRRLTIYMKNDPRSSMYLVCLNSKFIDAEMNALLKDKRI